MRGRVAVLHDYGQQIEIEEFALPDPEPGGLIVKIEQAAICGSDLHVWRGDTAADARPPSAMGFGHEGFGTVFALGEDTTVDDAGRPLAVGDRVIHTPQPYPGRRMPDPNLAKRYGEYPFFFSTFADYFYVGANRPVYRVPDGLTDDVLPSVNCAMGAAINGLITGGAGFGSKVVIFGAGGLGLTAAAAARDMGASHVVVLDRIPERLELAKRFGAHHVINVDEHPEADERVALVKEATEGGADLAMEFVGLASLLPEGVAMLDREGTFMEMGLFWPGNTTPFDPSAVLRERKRILGLSSYPASLVPKILDFLARNAHARPFAEIFSEKYPLEEINEAFARADWKGSDNPPAGRIAIVP